MSRFKKKLSKEEGKVLLYDLGCFQMKATDDNLYHYQYLKQNIMDLAGLKEKDLGL